MIYESKIACKLVEIWDLGWGTETGKRKNLGKTLWLKRYESLSV